MVTPHGRPIPVTTSSGTRVMPGPHVGVSQLQIGAATDVVIQAGPEPDLGGDRCHTARSFNVGQPNMGGCTPSAISKALLAAS